MSPANTTAASHARLVVIKIGTNVITKDDGLLNTPVLRHIVEQVSALKKRGMHVILVSSGAVAAGRALLTPSLKDGSIVKRQMLAAVGQTSLMHEYMDVFQEHGNLCAQVLTTKEDFRTRRHYLNMKNCFAALLKDNVIPIVNENDVISVEELMFTDNDELAGLITSMVNADTLIIMTSVDGVLGEHGIAIPVIEPEAPVWKDHIRSGTSQFGKGGMYTKCSIAQKLAVTGISVHIVNGRTENILDDALGEKPVGTYFSPDKKASNVKRWIAHAEGTEKGKVIVNPCAAKILQSEETVSLLPVGVVTVEGEFEKGDIVQICDESGTKLGLGKAEYGALRARSLTGKKNQKPLIHYDYLFIA